jgi:serine protease AprX
MEVTRAVLEEMLASEKMKKIYLNREVKALLDVAIPSVHVKNVVRNQTLLTGKGVNIAFLDTGFLSASGFER